ncbi:Kinesin-like protein kif3b [Kappamyces sp. JEL0829]|nr:Kinesin-like protein kif3b [Kappamyces sp. JEL0829]
MGDKESVRVVLRCRPFSEKEKAAGHSNVVKIEPKAGTVSILDPKQVDPPKTFTFDNVFDSNCTQTEVYSTTARDIVSSVLNGYNGTVFAYGQTGTGKTFSMEGIRNVPELRGIIPMAFDHIFGHIENAGAGVQFLVRASYLEIYNEEIRDLLNINGKRLEIKERPDTGVYVKDLSSHVIKTIEEMDQLMSMGNKNRSVGFTEMNATSSRSHSIFTITVEASELDEATGDQRIRAGKLHLVDLAGSERQSKTGATGDRLKEATKINLSLSALGNVISALVDGKSMHIPYRDSKLTRLLQDSLGGNAKTLMVATMSPASYNYDETVSTLRYANRAKNIKNKPKVNEDPKDAMLREFQEEIKRLKQMLEEGGPVGENGEIIQEVEEVEEVEVEETDSEDEVSPRRRSKSGKAAAKKSPRKSKTSAKTSKEGSGSIPESELAAMQELVNKEKRAILATKDMEESEKKRLLEEASKRDAELENERGAREALAEKLAEMEKKLLVGGVNILDQHQQQQIELARKAQELEEKIRKQRELERDLDEKEELNLQIEESFSNLQEEAAAKTKKLKRLWTIYTDQKSELKDLKVEQQREREDLLETVRELTNEIKLRQVIIQGFVPAEELEIIYDVSEYDGVSEKWAIAHMELAGNNLSGKRTLHGHKQPKEDQEEQDPWDPMVVFPDPFLSYDVPGLKIKKEAKKIRAKKSDRDGDQTQAPKARGLVSTAKHYA